MRAFLRRETADSHDRLDRAVAALRLEERGEYAGFLRLQLAARAPIERWAARHSPPDLLPPSTVPLLLADLGELGASTAVTDLCFEPPAAAHPLGLAWAVAGSHLGNRALLAHLQRSGGDRAADFPTTFLADPRMAAFWKALRPRLEQRIERVAGSCGSAEHGPAALRNPRTATGDAPSAPCTGAGIAEGALAAAEAVFACFTLALDAAEGRLAA